LNTIIAQETIDINKSIAMMPLEKTLIAAISSHRLPLPGSGVSRLNEKTK
jgi:hypothetical protein